MPNTNDFLPFCGTTTGTNLLTQANYITDAQRPIGNQTGVARSQLVNKALRQATWIASQIAQFVSDKAVADVLDDENSSTIQASMKIAFKKAPTVQKFLSGSGTYTTPANVTYIRVTAVGGGGGGGGGGQAGTASDGTDGGNTTFGTSLIQASGGIHGQKNAIAGTGGAGALGSGPLGIALSGGGGGAGVYTVSGSYCAGGVGASSALGGAGTPGDGYNATVATDAAANTGGGGGGGGGGNGSAQVVGGGGGGSGGYVQALIDAPAATYAYAVGAAGALGAAGTTGEAGSNGAAGVIIVEEYYQ